MAPLVGVKPTTADLEGLCSIQLSYKGKLVEQKGVEPSLHACKACVLPLNDSPNIYDVLIENYTLHSRGQPMYLVLLLKPVIRQSVFIHSLLPWFLTFLDTKHLVPPTGIEPASLSARDFKSLVFTYFTTWAWRKAVDSNHTRESKSFSKRF